MLESHVKTRRAYCRVFRHHSRLLRPGKRNSPGFFASASQVLGNRLTALLCQLEPDWPAGLPLPCRRTIDGNPGRGNVLHHQVDDIAPSQLAIDREIEHCAVARSSLDLQFGVDGPNGLGSDRRLRAGEAGEFAFVRRASERGSRTMVASAGPKRFLLLCAGG